VSERKLTIILLAILVSLLAIVIGWYLGRESEAELPVEVEVPLEPVPEGTGVLVDLYFPGGGTQLYAEQREVPEEGELDERLGRLLQELKAGPQSVELYSPLPEEISVGWVHINSAKVAYIDLMLVGETARPAWGSGYEMLSIYSIVNTVLLNIPEISSVILLRNGQQRSTFAGHIDTSRPLAPNRDLIASLEP
jgi:hypothetical protein